MASGTAAIISVSGLGEVSVGQKATSPSIAATIVYLDLVLGVGVRFRLGGLG